MADKSKATEAAEAKAEELGVDLASVQGSGSSGTITVADVESAEPKEDKLIIAKFNPRLGDLPRLVLHDAEGNARLFSERDEQSMLMSESQLKEFNEVNKHPSNFHYLLKSRAVS